ncbi:hemolysin XhlA family protein [Pseudomonas sp. MAP12]|uniref:Hemolysin XhlA family protein n=1 Tax=Geopseudomonas aromaticivorans TaxID=2849492 RepID=A0ABS6MT85_9GAMM|nr:hemolysin XhlA family protein [Pseudomonas aromaticivorans]MBV2132024.1 hemolysin XhlA family protein [Pseudomonas aromaticivorans]
MGEVVGSGSWTNRRGGNDTGGNPPGGNDMEKRVEALEKAIPDIRERLVRLETKLDSVEKNMATRSDMAELRADMVGEIGTVNQSVANFRTEITRLEGTMIKWFIGTALVLSGGIGAIAFGLARSLK